MLNCAEHLMAYFINDKCVGCTACETVCPVTAINGVKKEFYFIDPKICIDCGACEPVCPVEAIFEEAATPDKWKNFVQVDADWFKARKG